MRGRIALLIADLIALVNGGGGGGGVGGPGSAVADDFATFNGTTGQIIKDSGLALSTSTSLGSSDLLIPSQKAVKVYADTVMTYADSVGAATLVLANAYTDAHAFSDELVQDAVAAMILNGTGITWSYNDILGQLTATVTITQYSDELAQDALAAAFAAGTHTGLTITYDDVNNKFTFVNTVTQYTDEMAQDALNAAFAAGSHTGITITYDDVNNKFSFASTITQYTDELAQDAINSAFVAGTHVGLTITYDDTANKFSFTNTITQYTDEMAQDAAAALIVNGTGITWSYNDVANTLTPTVTITQYTDELAQDAAAAMIVGGTHVGLTVSYNDAGNTFSFTNTITQYTTELAQDAAAAMIVAGVHSGISVSYDDVGNAFSLTNLVTDETIQDLMAATLVGGTAMQIVYSDGPGLITLNVVPTTDGTMGANSDSLVPSQKAVRTYARSKYAILQAFTGTLDAGLENGVLCCYSELNEAGLLSKLLGLWVFCVPTEADALRNWMSPGTRDLIKRGTPTFTADQGFTGNGTDGYLDTNATAAVFGIGQDSASYGIYISVPSALAKGVIGNFDAALTRKVSLTSAPAGSTLAVRVNAAGTNNYAVEHNTGLFVIHRDNAATVDLFHEGVLFGNAARASTAQSTAPITFLAIADTTATEFSTAKAAFAFVGVALTRREVAALHRIMYKFYASRVGGSVAPSTVDRIQSKSLSVPTNSSLVVLETYLIHADTVLTLNADSIMRIM